VVNVVNRHRDQAIETEFELEDKQFEGPVEAAEVKRSRYQVGEQLRFHDSEGGLAPGKGGRRKLRYSFPAHSYTMLKAKLA